MPSAPRPGLTLSVRLRKGRAAEPRGRGADGRRDKALIAVILRHKLIVAGATSGVRGRGSCAADGDTPSPACVQTLAQRDSIVRAGSSTDAARRTRSSTKPSPFPSNSAAPHPILC
jgi:hypothetical protein